MKKLKFLLALLLLVGISSCNSNNSDNSTIGNSENDSSSIVETSSSSEATSEIIDYASTVKFDPNDTSKVYAEVKVNAYIDGDTTHFVPVGEPKSWIDNNKGVLKARYNCVDTPESTGKVEPWGVAAKKYTNSHLKAAQSIIVQSDTDKWNTDSTGGRYLVWVWYKAVDATDYKLLNLELIQEGLAKLKSASNFSLADVFQKANLQSMQLGLKLYNPKLQDPDFFYGDALSVTLKELRLHIDEYKDKKISTIGLITYHDGVGNTFYVSQYENGYSYSMPVYYAFQSIDIIKVGTEIRVVGTVQFFDPSDEGNGTWQISGVNYDFMDPDNDESLKVISENNEVKPYDVKIDDFSLSNDDIMSFEETVVDEETGEEKVNEIKILPGDLIQGTYVSYKNLHVYRCYTTKTEGSKNKNAISLYCRDENGNELTVRTSVLYKRDENGDLKLIKEAEFLNKTINVLGVMEKYNEQVQIHLFKMADVTFVS